MEYRFYFTRDHRKYIFSLVAAPLVKILFSMITREIKSIFHRIQQISSIYLLIQIHFIVSVVKINVIFVRVPQRPKKKK